MEEKGQYEMERKKEHSRRIPYESGAEQSQSVKSPQAHLLPILC